MKKYLLAGLVIAGAAIGTANAQSYSAPANRNTDRIRNEQPVTPITRRGPVGAITRGARGGNPAQLINPAAPRRYYGAPEETISPEEQGDRGRNAAGEGNHFRSTGVILFGLRF